MAEKFDPSKHMTKLKGKDYLEVAWRLVWLRQEHPDAAITMELVAHDREARWAMFKARVSIPGGGSAEGYGQEDAAGFQGNPGDYPEKASTKALGRALAALGYGTQFAGLEFDEGGERVVDAPVSRPVQTPPQSPPLATNGVGPKPQPTLTIGGVACVEEDRARTGGPTLALYRTVARCEEHGSNWYTRRGTGPGPKVWEHKSPSGAICTMTAGGAGRASEAAS